MKIECLPSKILHCCFYIFLIIFISCEKEKDYPVFGKIEIETISNYSFVARAEVIDQGEYGIIDYGFIFQVFGYEPDPSTINGTKFSLGRSISNDTFAHVIIPDVSQIQYYETPKLYVKAYMTDSKGTVYSEFAIMPVIKLKAASIIPSLATPGDTITILGTGFNIHATENTVTFNNIAGTVLSATDNALKVIVPAGIQLNYWESNITVVVKTGGMVSQLNSFQLAPSPISYSPSTGSWDDLIVISGSGLQNCSVLFNDRNASLSSRSSSEITCYIPQDFYTKRFKIYLLSGGDKIEVPGGNFVMDDLVLNVTRTKYFPGEYLVLTGEGFHHYSNENYLLMGSYSVVCSSSYNNLEFEIPPALNEGIYEARVTNRVDTVTLSENIEIIKPKITSVSLNSAYPGTQIEITGTDLCSEIVHPNIQLGTSNFSPVSETSSKITFVVPHYIFPGEYELILVYNQFEITCPDLFTVLAPALESIIPASGVAGSSAVIYGEGFVNNGYIEVYFGNVRASVMSVSDNQINVKIPDSLTTGTWSVLVYNSGTKIPGTLNFTVN